MAWGWKREKKEVKTRVATERLNEECVRKRYKERLEREWTKVIDGSVDEENIHALYEVFGVAVNSVTEEVCGVKRIKGNSNRGDAWWTNEVKEAVERKRKAYNKWNEKNVPAEIRRVRRQEYIDSRNEVKRIIRESKKKVDEDFGMKL